MTQCLEGCWRLADSKVILPKHLNFQILCKMHCAFHMEICRMQDLQRHSEVKVKKIEIRL